MEFERIRMQLNELKDATNKQKTQQKSERSELEKQLTFYKDKFEKLEQEKVEQKTTKNEDLPLRKQNLKPLDIPVSKWYVKIRKHFLKTFLIYKNTFWKTFFVFLDRDKSDL